MPINKDPSSPPPVIGKMGPYTIFITPPPQPPQPVFESPKKVVSPPPVQLPPIDKSDFNASARGLFSNALTKLQNANSSLDEHLARWFGLNHSKYQWALDDYLENKGLGKEGAKVKDLSSKIQNV